MNAPALASSIPPNLSLSGVQTAPAWLAAIGGDLDAAMSVARMLANSGLVPQAYAGKPEAIMIASAMGGRLGLDTFSSLSAIAVINGRPTIWGDAMLAICQARLDWAGQSVKDTGEGFEVTARRVLRSGSIDEYTGRFSVANARTAGLWGKAGPWTQYPQRMLEVRARAFALRGLFADALSGFACREEMEDVEVINDARGVSVSTPEQARTGDNAQQDTTVKDAVLANEKGGKKSDKKDEKKAAPTQSLPPAVLAARTLWTDLNITFGGDYAGATVDRIAALNGGAKPKDVPAANLEQFAKDVAAVDERKTNKDDIEAWLLESEKLQAGG